MSKNDLASRLLLLCCGWLLAGAAFSQTNLEANAGIQFNFSTPGAGNLALGGAFLALADDATAAYTNPAGLPHLDMAQLHLEVRHWSYTHVFTDHGRLQGEPTGLGMDKVMGRQDGKADDRVTGLSFISYVHLHKDWAFALYRHELVNFEANFTTQGAFVALARLGSNFGIPGLPELRLASLRNTMNLNIVNHGTSIAYRFGPSFSIGTSISYYAFDIDSRADRFLPALYEPMDFDDPNLTDKIVNFQTQHGNDSDWGLTAGFLWQSTEQKWSLGGVYRQGPSFAFTTGSRRGPADTHGFPDLGDKTARFYSPDVYGLGLAYRPNDAIRLTFDYNHVEYSSLTRGFIDIFSLEYFFPYADPELDKFRVNDADEFHFGLEYSFLRVRLPFAVRVGAWLDPDHNLHFNGDNQSFSAIFRERGDEVHFSAGVGTLHSRRYQLDVAFDYSERVSTGAFSLTLHL